MSETCSQPTLSHPHRVQGRLRLQFAHDPLTQLTQLATCEQQQPLQVIRAFPLAYGGALVHLHNLSGGILGGDLLTLEIEVGADAYAQLTSTSATRLYRCRPAAPMARQTMTVQVHSNGLLEYVPDPLIPFAGARYQQQTQIDLADGAGRGGQGARREGAGAVPGHPDERADHDVDRGGDPEGDRPGPGRPPPAGRRSTAAGRRCRRR